MEEDKRSQGKTGHTGHATRAKQSDGSGQQKEHKCKRFYSAVQPHKLVEQRIIQHDPRIRYTLNDYTNWPLFLSRLWRNSKIWFDHVCWSLVNIVILVAMWAVGIIGPCVSKPFQAVSDVLHSLYPMPCNPADGLHKAEIKHRLSAVNAETPDLHLSYLNKADKIGGTDLTKREFDLDNALLFIHLCALVYEDETVLEYILKRWHIRYEVIFAMATDSQAWVFYHSTTTCPEGKACPRRKGKGQDFIAVVFKGTSPFNFVEWMVDFTMSKISPHDDYLPGMVHEGFYEQFQWPIYLRPLADEGVVQKKERPEKEKQQPLQATDGFECSKEEIAHRLGKDGDWSVPEDSFKPKLTFYELVIRRTNSIIQREFHADHPPAIWIAGHSLGAALATIFFSHLLHSPEFPLTIPREALKGGYSFGTPRTGDATYANEIARHPTSKYFYDVINANDIVCTVPLGGNALSEDPRALTNFQHVGTPVLLNYWPTLEVGKRWALSNAIGNTISHYILWLPYHLRTSKAKILTFVRFPMLLVFFLVDHFPSEYVAHLQACKRKSQS